MAKYGKAAEKNVESTMRRRKRGTLKSGSGRKVTSRKQAIAIALNEAREKGAKVPRAPRSRKTAKKASRKRAAKSTSRASTRKTSGTSTRKASRTTKRKTSRKATRKTSRKR